MIQMNLFTKQRKRLTDLENELMVAWGERTAGRSGKVMYTLLCSKWIPNKDLFYSTWNYTQYYALAWMGGGIQGRMDTLICMPEPLCCSPKTTTTLLISYIPIQNKKSKV